MKKNLIDYYQHISQYYALHHNHKELAAWAGLVLHLAFCGLMIGIQTPSNRKFEIALGLTIIMLFIAFFDFLYVQNQLNIKDNAGALAGAAMLILAELIQKDKVNVKSYLSVVESADPNRQSSHVLPDQLLKRAAALNARARGHQDKIKWMIYTLLLLSTLSVIGIRWALAFT